MKISIVVISHNKKPWLEGVLRVLDHVDFPPQDFEVLVINDGSSDGTRDWLDALRDSSELSYTLRPVHRPQGGRAAARNTGCAKARGELLITLDDDCLMPPWALGQIWDCWQQQPRSLLLSAISHVAVDRVPEVLEEIGQSAVDESFFQHLDSLAPDDSEYALEELFRRMLTTSMDRYAVPWVAAQGSSAAFPKVLFDEIGGYDEGFRKYGMEDFEFALRAYNAGYQFRPTPASVRYHHLDHGHHRAELFKESTDSVRYFFRKYRGKTEVAAFIKFLCGALSFKELNNRVAVEKGLAPIEDLDLRFSPYGMVSYRDRQKGGEMEPTVLENTPHDGDHSDETGSQIQYDKGSEMKIRYLIGKLGRDLEADNGGLSDLPRWQDWQGSRVLVLAPHMDDEVIGCGGLISRLAAQGSHVTVAFMTNGAPERLRRPDLEGLRLERRAESAVALKILGVAEPVYLDFPDGELRRFEQTPGPLVELIRKQSPDLLLVPADTEYHPDHRATYRWTLRALAELRQRAPIPRLICYEVCGNCRPNRALELDTSVWATKMHAMKAYLTQLRDMDYCRLMTFIAETRGRAVAAAGSRPRAEVFRAVEPEEIL